MEGVLGAVIVIGTILFFRSSYKAVVDATKTLPQTPIDLSMGGYCVQVYGGDTIECRLGGRNVHVRLYGIYAPEEAHDGKPTLAFARESTGYLAGRILNAWVSVIPLGEDPHKRTIARVLVGEEDISFTMVKLGMAEASRTHLMEPYLTQYCMAEEEARNNRMGLWN